MDQPETSWSVFVHGRTVLVVLDSILIWVLGFGDSVTLSREWISQSAHHVGVRDIQSLYVAVFNSELAVLFTDPSCAGFSCFAAYTFGILYPPQHVAVENKMWVLPPTIILCFNSCVRELMLMVGKGKM